MNTQATILCSAALLASTFGMHLQAASTLQFEYTTYTAPENAPSVLVAVVRSGDTNESASVDVASVDVRATAGEDYEATSLTVEFEVGEAVQTFRVPLLNDGAKEPDERIRLTLSNPSPGSTLGAKQSCYVTIKDNDPGVQFTWKHFWGYEADGELSVEIERGNDRDLSAFTVDYATSDDTALAGQDYTAITGTLEFAEGEMTKTITIPWVDDAEAETREQIQITLTNATGPGGIGGNSSATLYLYDTTGHEPRAFGPITLSSGPGQRFFRAPLLGGANSSNWFEFFRVDASADLKDWSRQTWIAGGTANEPPTLDYQYKSGPTLVWYVERQFFRLHPSTLVAAWPPPDRDAFVWRYPGSDRVGDSSVGYTERWLTDPTRRNRYGISDNNSFRVAIWYPGAPVVGALPRQLMSSQEIHYWMDGWDYSSALPTPDMATYSFTDAPFGEGDSEHPIVLYSHILTLGSQEVCNLAEYLASRGYVVVVPDHEDCWTTTLEDGGFYGTTAGQAYSAMGFQDRKRDFEVILDTLTEWQVADPILQGRLNLGKIAAIGQQSGGAVAGELCRTVEACQAGVLVNVWDAVFVGADTLLKEGPGKPLMFVQHQGEKWKGLFDTTGAEATWFEIADSKPSSLHAWAHWEHAALNRVARDREVSRTMHAYIGSFLDDKFDRGRDPLLWRGPSDDYPDVINYERK